MSLRGRSIAREHARPVIRMQEIVDAIEAAAPEAAGKIEFDDVPLPFPEGVDAAGLEELVGYAPSTPLADGVRETIDLFRRA